MMAEGKRRRETEDRGLGPQRKEHSSIWLPPLHCIDIDLVTNDVQTQKTKTKQKNKLTYKKKRIAVSEV